MKYKILIVFFLTAVLTFSITNFAQAVPPTPPAPNTGTGHPTPPAPNVGNETQPFKERLEAFYIAKENYINQKRMCKESSAATNAPSGTCWNKLKPLMQRILLNEVDLTEKRLIQLQEQNITFPNRNEIDAKLAESKAVFADSSSSKYAMKSAAKNVEDLVNQIEEVATQNQPEILIRQMDNLMVKADSITTKLDAKLFELKASGYNTAELENSLTEYKADLAKTKEEIANAKARYAKTNNTQDISQMAKEVRNFINNAQNYLVKAFDKARAMVPEMSDAEKGGKGKSSKEGAV
jgi:hypothetical protein